jgi:hypothetical protein
MWLCLSDAFLSIVTVPGRPEVLKVRSRCPGHIERSFPGVVVSCTPGRDYLYRAEISRSDVCEVLSKLVGGINYPNFKDSVEDTRLHAAYADIWRRIAKLQPIPPYQTR